MSLALFLVVCLMLPRGTAGAITVQERANRIGYLVQTLKAAGASDELVQARFAAHGITDPDIIAAALANGVSRSADTPEDEVADAARERMAKATVRHRAAMAAGELKPRL